MVMCTFVKGHVNLFMKVSELDEIFIQVNEVVSAVISCVVLEANVLTATS